MASHRMASSPWVWSSGPFALADVTASVTTGRTHLLPVHTGVESCSPSLRLTCPSVPAVTICSSSPAHQPTSARFRARAPGPVTGQLYKAPAEEPGTLPCFPAAFRPPAFASWASFPARGFRPPYGRPTTPPISGADPNGVSMFRTRETRLAQGALFTPGAAVPARPDNLPGRRLPHLNGQPLSPWTTTRPRTYQ